MGMSFQAVLFAGIFALAAVPSPVYSQASTSSVPGKQQQIETHSRQAQEFLRQGHSDQAIGEYRAILAMDANNVDARGNLGVALFFQGDYAKAAVQLRGALKLRPSLSKIQALLGLAEKRTGQMSAAQADLEQAFPRLQEEKLRIQVGMELIEIDYGAAQLDKAAGVVGILRQLAPEDTDILYTAYRIHSDLAGESMLTMAMLAPKSARMHQMMAQEMSRQGNIEGAIAHYREAVKIDPRLPGLRFELAEALNLSSSAENQEQVEKEYRTALADNPFDEKAECRLGDIALRGADLQAARTHYARALELQPNDAEANLGMGRTLTQLSRPAEAEPYLKRSVEIEPFTAAAHYRLALVYRATGRGAEAQKELAEFQRLKDLKERLKQVYEEMKLMPVKQEKADSDIGK